MDLARESSQPVNPKSEDGICQGKTINGQKQEQFSAAIAGFFYPSNFLLSICTPSVAYFREETALWCLRGEVRGPVTALPEIIASLSVVWCEQTQHTHAEQNCQRQMSAHHSPHINTKPVPPEQLPSQRGDTRRIRARKAAWKWGIDFHRNVKCFDAYIFNTASENSAEKWILGHS